MREILFRGKRIGANRNRDGLKTGIMVYGSLFVDHKGQAKIKWYNEEYGSSITSIVEPETVGQYTGLTDKNGKKIFEGDVVESIFSEFKGVVVFDEYSRFMIKGLIDGRYYLLAYNNDDCEIIGNIHDNPELLKGGDT